MTQEELLAELQRLVQSHAVDDEPGTIIRTEWERVRKVCPSKAAKELRQMADAGALESAMVWRKTAWGYSKRIAGYRIKQT
jgi:hypothetical protein